METAQLLSFLSASVILALMPGPDNIFVLTESLVSGKRKGILIATGLCLGVIVHTTAAATGLSLLLKESALAFNLIKYAGATYLFYLAFMATKDRAISVNEEAAEATTERGIQLIKKGFFMNILNPKVSLFFIAFLPQFIVEGTLRPMVQMLVLGLAFMLSSMVVFCAIAFMANTLTPYLNSQRFWKVTKELKVSTLCVLGLLLAVSTH